MVNRDLIAYFIDRAEFVVADVEVVNGTEELGRRMVEVLQPLGNKVALVDSPLSKQADLETVLREAGFEVEKEGVEFARQADIGIVEFEYGIAETGTVVMDATDYKSRLATSLPLKCVALLAADKIKNNLEEVLDIYLQRGVLPGYLTLVTGPSRTTDVECILTIGVHGPEKLVIFLLAPGGERHVQ